MSIRAWEGGEPVVGGSGGLETSGRFSGGQSSLDHKSTTVSLERVVQAIDKLGSSSIDYFIARPFVVHEVEELAYFDTARAAPFYYVANSCI
ncbi:hypothetical protein ACLB2K_004635 [Fragaria x ananassa]